MSILRVTTLLVAFLMLLDTSPTSSGGVVFSMNDITVTEGQAGLDAFAFQVDITSTAGETIQSAVLDFGIGAGDGSLGVSITSPVTPIIGLGGDFTPWVGTVWDTNENASFSASDTDSMNDDISQLSVLNGSFFTGTGFSEIDLPDDPVTGIFANYVMDISGLSAGIYDLNLNINSGTVANEFGTGAPLTTSGGIFTLTVNAAATVPEPGSFALVGFGGLAWFAVRRRRHKADSQSA